MPIRLSRRTRNILWEAVVPGVIVAVFLLILAIGMPGCGARAIGGPSSVTDRTGAKSTNYPGSNMTLHADGTWTTSAPQQFGQSGIDMTDDRSSAIMPETANGARVNGAVATIVTGGDLSIDSLIARFEHEPEVGPVLREFELRGLKASKAEFYDMVEAVSAAHERIAVALGDDATQRLVEAYEGLKGVMETPAAQAFLEAAITGLTGGM